MKKTKTSLARKIFIYSNIIGGFADGGINCTGSSAGSYNVALF